MDPMEVLIRRKADEASKAALIDGLRRKRDVSMLAQLSGDPTTQQFGGNLYSSTEGQRQDYIAQQEKADQRALTQSYYDQMERQSALSQTLAQERMAETKRHNQAMEAASMQRASLAGRKMPTKGAVDATNKTVLAVQNLDDIETSFKDDYGNNTSVPFEGVLSNTLGKSVLGSEAQKDQADWWSRYQQIYELGTRNELFGSALTAQEIAAWRQANISPNSPPDMIRRGLTIMRDIANRKLQQQYSSDSVIYDPSWVGSVYSPFMEQPTQTPSQAPSESGVVNWSDL